MYPILIEKIVYKMRLDVGDGLLSVKILNTHRAKTH